MKHRYLTMIDEAQEASREPPRPHIGPSVMGHHCDRYIWLQFRWAAIERHEARMMRLFDRGHSEEASVIGLLRYAGFTVTAEQVEVQLYGHLSGTADAIVVPPDSESARLLEIKTSNSRAFKELSTKGVKSAKPMHWAQMQVYMHALSLESAIYYCVCKDNDDVYIEEVSYVERAARQLLDRGYTLSTTEDMPPPISTDPTHWRCKMCSCYSFCHQSQLTREVNCRTCAHSTPHDAGIWTCDRYQEALSYQAQLDGCSSHVLHPDLVPWPLVRDECTPHIAAYNIDGTIVYNGEPGVGVIESETLVRY